MSTLLTQIQKPLALRATMRGKIKKGISEALLLRLHKFQTLRLIPNKKKRKYASNRQAHQSTPLLENCVALIRHVIQQLVHLGVSQHSKPIRTSPPTFHSGRRCSAEDRPQSCRQTQNALALRKECQGPLKWKTSLTTSLAWLMCHAQYNEAQAAPKSTPTWLSQPVQHTFFRKCAVAWTKWPRAHPSSSRPPACTYARTCDPHTLTSVCHHYYQTFLSQLVP